MQDRSARRRIGGLTLGAGLVAGVYLGARSRGGGPRETTYPPLDTPKVIADGIWVVDSGPIRPAGLSLPVRMTVLRTPDGALMLHSPCHYTPELARQLEEIAPIRHLIAPSTAHWTFLKGWQAAYPDAVTWAVPGLRDRAQVRKAQVRIDKELGDDAPSDWASAITQGIVRGRGLCEAYFFHTASRTLILTDLIENLRAEKLPPGTAAVMGGLFATRGSVALHARAALLLGGDAARVAIARMVDLAPDVVLFAHGDVFMDDAAARLRRAFAWLL
jgi:hypothetical protein